eukprot:4742157-Heterocapsa_arctica.AAC.1
MGEPAGGDSRQAEASGQGGVIRVRRRSAAAERGRVAGSVKTKGRRSVGCRAKWPGVEDVPCAKRADGDHHELEEGDGESWGDAKLGPS